MPTNDNVPELTLSVTIERGSSGTSSFVGTVRPSFASERGAAVQAAGVSEKRNRFHEANNFNAHIVGVERIFVAFLPDTTGLSDSTTTG